MEAPESLTIQTRELYEAIGESVVVFQQIEQWLAEILAVVLRMRHADDQYLVSAAMSFSQKVDLLCEVYPKRKSKSLPDRDMVLIRASLYKAEQYRNRVVHSFWGVECADQSRWVRIKGSLRGKSGFSKQSVSADLQALKSCNGALRIIREWIVRGQDDLHGAMDTLTQYMQPSALGSHRDDS
ncbi:MAG: hypothetical protein EVA65_04690 [Oceanococcus sp.]|nr:MAG: hypothetical protein EVA65_04690 [Oceanococcus sp.]